MTPKQQIILNLMNRQKFYRAGELGAMVYGVRRSKSLALMISKDLRYLINSNLIGYYWKNDIKYFYKI